MGEYSVQTYAHSVSIQPAAPWIVSDKESAILSRNVNSAIMAAAIAALSAASVTSGQNVDRTSSAYATSPGQGPYYSDHKSEIYAEILQLTTLPSGWDGGADDVAPSESAANDAILFLQGAPLEFSCPEPFAACDGELGLLWELPGVYLSVSFFGNGKVAYYGVGGGGIVKGKYSTGSVHRISEELAIFMSQAI